MTSPKLLGSVKGQAAVLAYAGIRRNCVLPNICRKFLRRVRQHMLKQRPHDRQVYSRRPSSSMTTNRPNRWPSEACMITHNSDLGLRE